MAFWGLEVKPGNPIYYDAIGKIIWITQATLGTGNGTERSAVQCRVGKQSPVLLCALTPNKVESQRLRVKFQEWDKVVFSIIGCRSIHLTGYYHDNILGSVPYDKEPYGIDIQNTESDDSDDIANDKYDYEDSFIDDSELSPGKGKPQEKKRSSEQLNKGKEIMNWKDESSDSEDFDDSLLTVIKRSKSNYYGSTSRKYN